MTLRLVVFDVDGTLVDSAANILAAFASAYAARGLVCPPDAEVLGMVGLSLPVGIERLSPELPEAERAALVQAYRAVYAGGRRMPPAPLFPGARAALDRLAARPEVLLAVATGKSRRGLDHLLRQHDLQDMFISLQVSDDHPSKPHPSMLEAVLAETGAAAAGAVMVGDTEVDMQMGRNAGFLNMGVSWGHHAPERLRAGGADQVIDGFAELIPALDQLWAVA
jgi:phosphoglycolate phosphatase